MPNLGDEIKVGDLTFLVTNMDTLKETIQIRHAQRTVEIRKSDLETKDKKYFVRKETVTRLEHAEDDPHEEEDTYRL